MASYKQMYEETEELNRKLINFVYSIVGYVNICIGCGAIVHPNYSCYECGLDGTDEDTFIIG